MIELASVALSAAERQRVDRVDVLTAAGPSSFCAAAGTRPAASGCDASGLAGDGSGFCSPASSAFSDSCPAFSFRSGVAAPAVEPGFLRPRPPRLPRRRFGLLGSVESDSAAWAAGSVSCCSGFASSSGTSVRWSSEDFFFRKRNQGK